MNASTEKRRRDQLVHIGFLTRCWTGGQPSYADLEAWRELQQAVAEEGAISVPVLTRWLNKEVLAVMKPAWRFATRERDDRGDDDCRSHHE